MLIFYAIYVHICLYLYININVQLFYKLLILIHNKSIDNNKI